MMLGWLGVYFPHDHSSYIPLSRFQPFIHTSDGDFIEGEQDPSQLFIS